VQGTKDSSEKQEIDLAAWFSMATTREKIFNGQNALLDELKNILSSDSHTVHQ
jgi:predicted NUDIX family NTP pyrophosphohydrolase